MTNAASVRLAELLCGIHAVNSILQGRAVGRTSAVLFFCSRVRVSGPYLTQKQLDSIAHELDEKERQFMLMGKDGSQVAHTVYALLKTFTTRLAGS